MRSIPSSVSFCTTHSGRSPLTGANATVNAGTAAASDCTAPSPPTPGAPETGVTSGPPCQVTRAQRPRPSVAMTSSPNRSRSTRPRWWTSSSLRSGSAGSSTKTCAAAAARTVMAA